MVMEPVEGMDMSWLLRRRRERPHESLSPAFVAEMARQVCRGLEYAHTLKTADGEPMGIVHRDITPPNIMVAWNGTVKILDFGIARAAAGDAARSLTDAGIVKGKMSTSRPSCWTGMTADARSRPVLAGSGDARAVVGRAALRREATTRRCLVKRKRSRRPRSATRASSARSTP